MHKDTLIAIYFQLVADLKSTRNHTTTCFKVLAIRYISATAIVCQLNVPEHQKLQPLDQNLNEIQTNF